MEASTEVKKTKKHKELPYLAPALITILILTVAPIIFTIVISFTDYHCSKRCNKFCWFR